MFSTEALSYTHKLQSTIYPQVACQIMICLGSSNLSLSAVQVLHGSESIDQQYMHHNAVYNKSG